MRTPPAAPNELAKYRSASARPGSPGARRIAPALMSGNVAPSSTLCGRISSAAMSHFAAVTTVPPPSAGKRWSYAPVVIATNSG